MTDSDGGVGGGVILPFPLLALRVKLTARARALSLAASCCEDALSSMCRGAIRATRGWVGGRRGIQISHIRVISGVSTRSCTDGVHTYVPQCTGMHRRTHPHDHVGPCYPPTVAAFTVCAVVVSLANRALATG
jgi:hypothetical protein